MADCDSNVPNYIVVPGEGSNIPGPPGPPGPQGPPGAGTIPLPASDVSVTNAGFNNAQEIFDSLLYVPLSITSFTATTSTYEIGTSITALGFNWNLNKADIISQSLTGPHNPIVLGVTERSASVNFSPPLASSATFTLSVDDGVQTINSNRGVNFYNGVYYGNSTLPITIDSNFIRSLTRSLQSGRGKSFNSNAGVDVYVWYAHKKSLGIASFQAGGFAGGFEPPITISFTNASGFTEDYYVYRSTNPQIGVVSIIVT